jgi:hypothetical protein
MTTQAISVSVDSILSLVQSLSLFDKATLLNALMQETGLSVFLNTHQAAHSISMQINGLDHAGMADVMNAIADSLRSQPGHHN